MDGEGERERGAPMEGQYRRKGLEYLKYGWGERGGGGENEREREMRLWRVSIGVKGWSILSMDGEREGGRERERCVYGWSVSS